MSKEFLNDAVKELLTTIKEYDSDTFFAKGVELTDHEALELAGRLIHDLIDNKLDGVTLDYELAKIRGL